MDTKKVVEAGVTRASPRFVRAFAAVHAAFLSSPEEIAEAKVVARANMVAAEDSYFTTAAMLEAGWDPLSEQAAAFAKRTGFTAEKHWPIEPTPNPEIRWPSLDLRSAA